MAIGGGAPSTGGGAGRRGGGGSGSAESRQTYIYWHEAALKTPAEVTPKEGEEAVQEADLIRDMLGMSEWDPKPVLLYFHREHDEESENADAGKPWKKQCGEIDDEKVARWAGLYHFVEVDVDKSEEKMLERFGATTGPSFAIVNQDLEVVATSTAIPNAKRFAGFLQTTVKSHFEEYWTTIQERLDEQKETLREVKSLEKKKDIVGALSALRTITRSSLRIGSHFDDAVKLDAKLTRKMENE
jgi:hypothetical protein